jgi:hypothetical protein
MSQHPIPKTPPKAHNASTYSNHRCRCDVCRSSWAAYVKKRQAERRAGIPGRKNALTGPKTHNANAYIAWGCRCDLCVTDYRIQSVRRRAERNSAIQNLISRHEAEFAELLMEARS